MKKLLINLLAFYILAVSTLLGKNSHLVNITTFNYTSCFPNDSTKGQGGQNKPHIPKPPKIPLLLQPQS